MALKRLGAVAPAATTETDLYQAQSETVISTFTVCNRSSTTATFRMSISQTGEATSTKDYIYYDVAIAGADNFSATLGLTMAVGDTLRVYSSNANLTFSAFGETL